MKNGKYNFVIAPPDYPGKKYRDRYCYEHIFMFWKNTGILPPKGYEIHHINGDHRDNRIENLKLLTSKEHKQLHVIDLLKLNQKRFQTSSAFKQFVTLVCDKCEKEFKLDEKTYSHRKSRNKSGLMFCSQECLHKHPVNSGLNNLRKKTSPCA